MEFPEIGGRRCDQVLEALDRYVDGLLSEEELAMVEIHVRSCDNCRRFGGAYARVVQALREPAGTPSDEAVPPEVLRRALASISG